MLDLDSDVSDAGALGAARSTEEGPVQAVKAMAQTKGTKKRLIAPAKRKAVPYPHQPMRWGKCRFG